MCSHYIVIDSSITINLYREHMQWISVTIIPKLHIHVVANIRVTVRNVTDSSIRMQKFAWKTLHWLLQISYAFSFPVFQKDISAAFMLSFGNHNLSTFTISASLMNPHKTFFYNYFSNTKILLLCLFTLIPVFMFAIYHSIICLVEFILCNSSPERNRMLFTATFILSMGINDPSTYAITFSLIKNRNKPNVMSLLPRKRNELRPLMCDISIYIGMVVSNITIPLLSVHMPSTGASHKKVD